MQRQHYSKRAAVVGMAFVIVLAVIVCWMIWEAFQLLLPSPTNPWNALRG